MPNPVTYYGIKVSSMHDVYTVLESAENYDFGAHVTGHREGAAQIRQRIEKCKERLAENWGRPIDDDRDYPGLPRRYRALMRGDGEDFSDTSDDDVLFDELALHWSTAWETMCLILYYNVGAMNHLGQRLPPGHGQRTPKGVKVSSIKELRDFLERVRRTEIDNGSTSAHYTLARRIEDLLDSTMNGWIEEYRGPMTDANILAAMDLPGTTNWRDLCDIMSKVR